MKRLRTAAIGQFDGALRRDPVEDPERLDERRAELGLMPIAEYERLLSDFYDAPIAQD